MSTRVEKILFKRKSRGSYLPADKGVVSIDVTSGSQSQFRLLSPFIVGPVKIPGLTEALNMENAWQFSKVYDCHVDKAGETNDEWMSWALSGFSSLRAVRYPKGKGAKPLYLKWGEKKLDYVSAKREVYFPVYRDLIKNSKGFAELEEVLASGKTIEILDYDVYSLEGKSLADTLSHKSKSLGHGFVIAAMLIYGKDVTPDLLDQMSKHEAVSRSRRGEEEQLDMFS